MCNRATGLLRQLAQNGDRCAIIYEGRQISFAALADDVFRAAGGLAHLGIGKGTRVGLMMSSRPDFVIVQQALFMLGAVLSPLNIFYRPAEIAHAVNCCELEYLLMGSDLHDGVPLSGRDAMASLRKVVLIDGPSGLPGFDSLPAAMAAATPIRDLTPVAPDDLVMLLHTSATTGKAKGVMLTAANLAANYDRTPAWLGLHRDDVILCALPLYNTFGLNQGINVMTEIGATLVILPRFDAQLCIEAIARHRCTFMPAVPTMLQKLVDHAAPQAGALASLRCIMTGGAPVPAALLARVLAATSGDMRVLTGYGLTEATALVTLTGVELDPSGELVRGRTVGRVLDGVELALADEQGALLPPGQTGEFVVRGPNVMAGYYRAAQDTEMALRAGWLHTGDLGYIDENGYAFIVDRKKDVIIRGGQNIYPADIEEVLYGVEGVAEAAVIGAPDEMLGEVPIAFVALRPGVAVTEAALAARCRDELAKWKQPHFIHILPELPKGPTGKILRRALRGQALPKGQAEAVG